MDLEFLETSAKIFQFIDPSLERTSLVDILGKLPCISTACAVLVECTCCSESWPLTQGIMARRRKADVDLPTGDIRRSMMKECDFVSEARNIEAFSTYLDSNGLRQVATAPFVFTQLSSKRCGPFPLIQGLVSPVCRMPHPPYETTSGPDKHAIRIFKCHRSLNHIKHLSDRGCSMQGAGDGATGRGAADRPGSHPRRHGGRSRASAHQVRHRLQHCTAAFHMHIHSLIVYD